jgi:hypothetical protein
MIPITNIQPESSVIVEFPFLPCAAYKQTQDHFAVVSFRFQELESASGNWI